MKELAENLTEGTSALFILIREATSDKVLDRLKEKSFIGKILQTSLAVDKEDELRKVLGDNYFFQAEADEPGGW
jgi:uncharacterized membrane protein